MALGSAGCFAPGAFAEELLRTAAVEEGPFYPDHLPLDTDNDLLMINDATTPAIGEVTHLSGRLLDAKGDPIKNALIEIWQVDSNGVYLRDRPAHPGKFDSNFQGFGRFLTGSTGDATSARSNRCRTSAVRPGMCTLRSKPKGAKSGRLNCS